MGIKLKCVLVLLLAAGLLANGAAGLGQAAATDKSAHPDQHPDQHLGRVYLDVVVAGKAGAPVMGLSQQDFSVLDNKVTQPIASFSPAGTPGMPVQVVLLVDVLNSEALTLAKERPELDRFLLANGRLRMPEPPMRLGSIRSRRPRVSIMRCRCR